METYTKVKIEYEGRKYNYFIRTAELLRLVESQKADHERLENLMKAMSDISKGHSDKSVDDYLGDILWYFTECEV